MQRSCRDGGLLLEEVANLSGWDLQERVCYFFLSLHIWSFVKLGILINKAIISDFLNHLVILISRKIYFLHFWSNSPIYISESPIRKPDYLQNIDFYCYLLCRHESEVVEEIVQSLFNKLRYSFSSSAKCLVGIDSQVDEVVRYLSTGSNEVQILGLWNGRYRQNNFC